MAAGDFHIRRNAADSSAIELSVDYDATWDTSVKDQGGTITYSGGVYTVPDAGPYFITYNEKFTAPVGNYCHVAAELLINDTPTMSGVSTASLPHASKTHYAVATGYAILELAANDTVSVSYVQHQGDQAEVAITIDPGEGGFQILQLSDDDLFGMYSTSSTQSAEHRNWTVFVFVVTSR